MKEDYPGQSYWHKLNRNIRRAEENWALKERKEYKHWPHCNGSRYIPAGEAGNCCSCFNSFAGSLTVSAALQEAVREYLAEHDKPAIEENPFEQIRLRNKLRAAIALLQPEFCKSCGAGIGKFRRDGEGTCPECDPEGVKKNPNLVSNWGFSETIPVLPEIEQTIKILCAMCETPMEHATGIGYYCPNGNCKNVDGPYKEVKS